MASSVVHQKLTEQCCHGRRERHGRDASRRLVATFVAAAATYTVSVSVRLFEMRPYGDTIPSVSGRVTRRRLCPAPAGTGILMPRCRVTKGCLNLRSEMAVGGRTLDLGNLVTQVPD